MQSYDGFWLLATFIADFFYSIGDRETDLRQIGQSDRKSVAKMRTLMKDDSRKARQFFCSNADNLSNAFCRKPGRVELLHLVKDSEGGLVGVFEGDGDEAAIGLELGNFVVVAVFGHVRPSA